MNLFLLMENVISEISDISACEAVQACVDMMYRKKYLKNLNIVLKSCMIWIVFTRLLDLQIFT